MVISESPLAPMRGVVSGVRDYGNRMGIPTVNGAVYFDERYLGNPLVYCGNVGLLPADGCFGKARPGDKIIVAGGRTGRDGIHGATFSSGELTHTSDTEFSHAVQIGNAITEKKVVDTLMQARDEGIVEPGLVIPEVGELLNEDHPGRTSETEITLFRSLGLAVEDLAAAQLVYQRAVERGVGADVDIGS